MSSETASLKGRIRNREMLTGIFNCIASFQVSEILSRTAVDFIAIEAEHAATSLPTIHAQIASIAGRRPVIVRAISDDTAVLKPILDLGVDGIMVPNVHTAEQAKRIIDLTRFAPEGTRGIGGSVRAADFGMTPNFYAAVEPLPVAVIVQAESVEGVQNARAIASVDGIDAVFFGPHDLSAQMGFRGRPTAPEVIAAIENGMAEVTAAGKAAGCLCAPDQIWRWKNAGGSVFLCGADIGLLTSGIAQMFKYQESARP